MSSLLLVPPTPRSAALEQFNQDLASGRAVDLRELTELTLIELTTDNPLSRGATVLEWNPDTRQVEFLERDGVLVNAAWCVSSGDWYKCGKRELSASYQVVGAQSRNAFELGHRLDYSHTRVLRTGLCAVLRGPRGSRSGCIWGSFLVSNWPVTGILLGDEAGPPWDLLLLQYLAGRKVATHTPCPNWAGAFSWPTQFVSTLDVRVLNFYNNLMTPRQQQILQAIVELYAQTAEPVGSGALCQQFEMSSATIRAEMAELERQGFIMQPHISAGRVPTDKGYRCYVNALDTTPADTRTEHALERRVKSAGEVERAIKNAVEGLAHVTHNLGLGTIGNNLYLSGMAGLFQHPEFYGGEQAYEVARLLDSLEEWLQEAAPNDPISVYIGQENPIGRASGATLIISRFESPYSARSYIGVLGPTRQQYNSVIGLVQYTGKLLEEALIK